MKNIKINSVATYHPENSVSNEFYLDHFSKRGENIEGFLKAMGRDTRFIIDNKNENSVTMAIEAAKRVLEKAQLTGKDIDMVVFSSQAPEFTFPANAMFVHQAIGAPSHATAFDSNANCAGMTLAVDNASRYMMSNRRVNRALIVGSDANSLISNPEQAFTYASFADGAAAIILEKTAEDNGYIDAVYEVESSNVKNLLFPQNGLSGVSEQKEYILFTPFDGGMVVPAACEMIETLLSDNELNIEDVDAFCMSQFALSNILKIQDHFSIPNEKIVYVGDKHGYTSTSSPFLALHEGIETGRIKRGDVVLFWTVGTGHQMIAMLFKY